MSNFNDIVQERVKAIIATLEYKAGEYAKDNNRFHNFDVAARIKGESPEKALYGMSIKHFVSVVDLVAGAADLPERYAKGEDIEAIINEKIGDMINYLILLEGLLKRRLNPIGAADIEGLIQILNHGLYTPKEAAERAGVIDA